MIGCIYKITVGEFGFYIGSAKNFNERLKTHKLHAKTTNSKIYKAIRENDGKFVMTKLYDVEYENNVELRIQERRCYDEMKPNLNTHLPYVSKEERKKYWKKYRIDNADKIKSYEKQYIIDNADKIKEKNNKYYIANVDKKKEYGSKYYLDNTDKINEQRNKKITCHCGCEVSYRGLKIHQTSKKHINMMIDK